MEKYVDSRGAEMEGMEWSEAVEAMWQLAGQNQLSERQAMGDDALEAVRDWQKIALDTVEDFVTNHAEKLDELELSSAAGDWPDDVWKAGRSMNATQPINALRICLDLATQGAVDVSEADTPELADEADRQQQSFDMVRDLLGMHGGKIAEIVTLGTSSFDRP